MPAASTSSVSSTTTGEVVNMHVAATDFKTLFDKSSQVDKALRNNLRKEIRNVAKTVADAAKAEVLQPPLRPSTSGMSRSTGLRQGIAAGIGVSILTGTTRVGVAITSSGKGLPSNERNLVRAYDRAGGWRHPVFGGDAWVTQTGRPYFYTVISRQRAKVTAAVTRAMTEAAQSLET